jgi:hypothetical protein
MHDCSLPGAGSQDGLNASNLSSAMCPTEQPDVRCLQELARPDSDGSCEDTADGEGYGTMRPAMHSLFQMLQESGGNGPGLSGLVGLFLPTYGADPSHVQNAKSGPSILPEQHVMTSTICADLTASCVLNQMAVAFDIELLISLP